MDPLLQELWQTHLPSQPPKNLLDFGPAAPSTVFSQLKELAYPCSLAEPISQNSSIDQLLANSFPLSQLDRAALNIISTTTSTDTDTASFNPQGGHAGPIDYKGFSCSSVIDPGFAERAARFSCFAGDYGSNLAQASNNSLSQDPQHGKSRSPPALSSNTVARSGGSMIDHSHHNLSNGSSVPSIRATPSSCVAAPCSDHLKQSPISSPLSGVESKDTVTLKDPSAMTAAVMARTATANAIHQSHNAVSPEVQSSCCSKKIEAPAVGEATGPSTKVAGKKRKAESIRPPHQAQNSNNAQAKHQKLNEQEAKNSVDSAQASRKESSKTVDASKQDFIHVRARRGQATDSHSLAERVRREKISERMKYLQDLVPSCGKVTGKAVVLDEIINYVQSLQRQVEFLSMKLAAVHPIRLDSSLECLFGKQMQMSQASDLHMARSSTPPLDAHSLGSDSGLEAHGGCITQMPQAWEEELQSVMQMEFSQEASQIFCSNQGLMMKFDR